MFTFTNFPSSPKKSRMLGFTLIELIVVMAIIGVLAAVTAGSFASSQRRGRDARRKSDLGQIARALETYYNDRGQYPNDSAGQILGCGTAASPTLCAWGQSFQQTVAGVAAPTIYMVTLPSDPRAPNTFYFYDRTAFNSYQLYARLENTEDVSVPKDGSGNPQVYSGVDCGPYDCNYGISSTNTTPAAGRSLVTE